MMSSMTYVPRLFVTEPVNMEGVFCPRLDGDPCHIPNPNTLHTALSLTANSYAFP